MAGVPQCQTPQRDSERMRERLITSWAAAPFWSPEEGAVLAYDLDPKEAIEHSATGYGGPSLRAPADARHLCDLAHRAIDVGSLEARPAPRDFMTWARSVGVDFAPDWWGAVADEEALPEDAAQSPPPAVPVPELGTRERETLLKMVAAMAMCGYRWDPNARRNEATAEIASDLASLGVPLDTDTIRKWLRKGAELIPRQDR